MQSLKCQEFYDAVTCHTWNTLALIFDKLLSVLDVSFRVLSFRSIFHVFGNFEVLDIHLLYTCRKSPIVKVF